MKNLETNSLKELPGINIQFPITRRILDGSKTIETRTYSLPPQYKNKDLYLIETPGAEGSFRARIIGIIRFSDSFQYRSKAEFYSDYSRHLVDKNSPYSWRDKQKWGWVIVSALPLKKTFEVSARRGIVFTKSIGTCATPQ